MNIKFYIFRQFNIKLAKNMWNNRKPADDSANTQ